MLLLHTAFITLGSLSEPQLWPPVENDIFSATMQCYVAAAAVD